MKLCSLCLKLPQTSFNSSTSSESRSLWKNFNVSLDKFHLHFAHFDLGLASLRRASRLLRSRNTLAHSRSCPLSRSSIFDLPNLRSHSSQHWTAPCANAKMSTSKRPQRKCRRTRTESSSDPYLAWLSDIENDAADKFSSSSAVIPLSKSSPQEKKKKAPTLR